MQKTSIGVSVSASNDEKPKAAHSLAFYIMIALGVFAFTNLAAYVLLLR